MFFVDQESIPGRKMLWKTSLAILVRLWRIIRASFSQERMTYIREESKVIYKSKDGRQQKAFDPPRMAPPTGGMQALAAMSSHIPDKGEQMVRYYGYYSNVCSGRRQKEDQDGLIPYIIEPQEDSKQYRKNWARPIRKIY